MRTATSMSVSALRSRPVISQSIHTSRSLMVTHPTSLPWRSGSDRHLDVRSCRFCFGTVTAWISAMSISIGIAGAGQFAPSFLRLFAAHPDVHEVRLADVLLDRLAEMAGQYEVAVTYSSYEELLGSDVDAVAVFTQRWLHGPMVIAALEAGKHVYSTVPMAIDADDIAAIVGLVERTGMTYMRGETRHYYPTSVLFRRKITTGELR